MTNYGLTPQIGDAKSLAKANQLRRCVILFETHNGRVGYASYGQTRALCQKTKHIMNALFDDLERRIFEDSNRMGLNK